MVMKQSFYVVLTIVTLLTSAASSAEQAGSIRGMVYDKDFEVPLAAAQVLIAETQQKVSTTDAGNFLMDQVSPGSYTLVFSKEGYGRQVKSGVVVAEGRMTELDAWLSGEFTEMEEFVVQDIRIGTGTEAALLDLRMESPALMDSVSSELMSQAGASDAASALRLVSGATVQDGKYAVIRGLPDRYVNSQMNGIRLPTADADKRAVQLDQFPASAIESIQVSKTFTPDQQGDASGGAVNIVLKGIPNERVLKVDAGIGYNSQASRNDEFLTYKGGGLDYWGRRQRSTPGAVIMDGPLDISSTDTMADYKYSVTFGDKYQLTDDVRIGGLGSYFYDRSNSHYDGGVDDKYWMESIEKGMVPQYTKGGFAVNDENWDPANPDDTSLGEEYFTTSLYDVTESSRQVQWGTLGVIGLETENDSLTLLHMYTRSAEDTVRFAQDTRGKAAYFPGYDPDDPCHPGNMSQVGRSIAPYLRSQTLTYTERTTETLQLIGRHELAFLPDVSAWDFMRFTTPEFDWKLADSSASLFQPDKTMFNSRWTAGYYVPRYPGFPPYVPPIPAHFEDPTYQQLIDGANINYGNFFRIWKDIGEESDQYAMNLKLPFEQWSGDQGYFKVGTFGESLTRKYNQDSYGNAQSGDIVYSDYWNNDWARLYYDLDYMTGPQAQVQELEIDMDYDGQQKISAWYLMADVPVTSFLNIIGGYRFETTELGITTYPEEDVEWIVVRGPDGRFINSNDLDRSNVDFKQKDTLPSIGFVLEPVKEITLRGSYTETIARQTFKELSAAPQQEYLGSDVFIGNPELAMSALMNYDLRLDYTPYEGGLVSASYFYKDVTDPIEYVQGITDFSFTTPVNYPEGSISGYELELRQKLGTFWKNLEGVTLGGNATLIDSEVELPAEESALFRDLGLPIAKRNMMNAPEHLYNLYVSYDIESTGTLLGLFYTVRGDTLVAGAGQSVGNFIPDVYETEYGTLNFSASQKLGEIWTLKFQAKNLLDPTIKSVYRSEYIGDDVTKTSYRKGMDFSMSLSAVF